jgi:hypothetical protein
MMIDLLKLRGGIRQTSQPLSSLRNEALHNHYPTSKRRRNAGYAFNEQQLWFIRRLSREGAQGNRRHVKT